MTPEKKLELTDRYKQVGEKFLKHILEFYYRHQYMEKDDLEDLKKDIHFSLRSERIQTDTLAQLIAIREVLSEKHNVKAES